MPRVYKPVGASSNKAETGPRENKSKSEVKTEEVKKKNSAEDK